MLIDYLPQRYQKGWETVEVVQAMDPAARGFADGYDHIILQLHVATATDGLVLWERMYGIATDENKTFAQRREQILAKMRSTGVTTVEVVERVAQSFFPNSTVTVEERYADYYFVIRYESNEVNFPDPKQVRAAVGEIKPAHLGMELLYVLTVRNQALVYTGVSTKIGTSVVVTPPTPTKATITGTMLLGGTVRMTGTLLVKRGE